MVDDHYFVGVVWWLCSLICGYLRGELKDGPVTFFRDGHGMICFGLICVP